MWSDCPKLKKNIFSKKLTKFWNSKISEFLNGIFDLPPQKMVHQRCRGPKKNQLRLNDWIFLNCGWNFFFKKFAPPHCPGTVRPTAMKFGTMVDLVGMYEVLQGNWDRMIGEWKKSIFPEKVTKFWNPKISELLNSIFELTPSKDGPSQMPSAQEVSGPFERQIFRKVVLKNFLRKICPPIAPERRVPQPGR